MLQLGPRSWNSALDDVGVHLCHEHDQPNEADHRGKQDPPGRNVAPVRDFPSEAGMTKMRKDAHTEEMTQY